MSTDKIAKFKEWMNENAPTLTFIYDNKYVGMAYDRFASLQPAKQKQIILGVFGFAGLFIFYIVLSSYFTLWSVSSETKQSYEMVTLLQQYQKDQQNQSGALSMFQRNNKVSAPGAFKQHLLQQAQLAGVSTRMVNIQEKPAAGTGGDEVKIREATVNLERVNLTQLRKYLNLVEFGDLRLSVSSLKVTNDDKLRGYMNVEMGIVAYLFASGQG